MDSTRQKKVSRLLLKEISEIFILNGRSYYGNSMVTVTTVRITPDMGIARVFLSIFPSGKTDKSEILKHISDHTKDIRWTLGSRVKNQLRIVPDLEFHIDDSLDYIENIENLLKK